MDRCRLRRQDGLALPVLLVVMAVLMGAGAALLGATGDGGRAARRELESEQAFYAAESGLQVIVARTHAWSGSGWANPQPPAAPPPAQFQLQGEQVCSGCRGFTVSVDWACQAAGTPPDPCGVLAVTSVGQAGAPGRQAQYTLRAEVRYESNEVRVAYLP